MTNNEKTVNVYSEIAKEYAKEFFDELVEKPLDRILYDFFGEKLKDKAKCLEIGCGPGEVSNYLFSKGAEITGIDKSKAMIDEAKKLNSRIKFMQGDVFNLPFGNGEIDGIVAPYLIVNFDNTEVQKSFSEMERVLAHGGQLLIVFHAGMNNTLTLRNFFHSRNSLTFVLHSVSKIKKYLLASGFKITEVLVKEPYKGEVTKRAFIFATKGKSVGKN